MKRVTRRGGTIVVCDGIASDDPIKAAQFNRFEVLRDPSTVRFLTEAELRDAFAEAGLSIRAERRYRVAADLDGLMKISFPNPGDETKARALFMETLAEDGLNFGARRSGDRYPLSYPTLILAAAR